MAQPLLLFFIVVSVSLSAFSQLLLKIGMSSGEVQRILIDQPPHSALLYIMLKPIIFCGLGCFGLSAIFWLYVLSKIDVSYAYPCVALGIVFTVAGAHFFLGESVSLLRLSGLGVITLGVALVAAGG